MQKGREAVYLVERPGVKVLCIQDGEGNKAKKYSGS